MAPYDTSTRWLMWFVASLALGGVTSFALSDLFRATTRRTAVFRRAHDFDNAVEELFSSSLRERSPQRVREEAARLGLDAPVIEDLLKLLDQLEQHDRATRQHSSRVGGYAALIGRELDLTREERELLNWSALLHDIGKLDVPRWLLQSPTAPNAQELGVMMAHPSDAQHRLWGVCAVFGESLADGARYHHEQWDGNGYPHGTSGAETPLFGRIIAIADAFDVLTQGLPYRQCKSIADAREELQRKAGTEFDPDLVATFFRSSDEELARIRGTHATGGRAAVGGGWVSKFATQLAIATATVLGATFASLSGNLPPEPTANGTTSSPQGTGPLPPAVALGEGPTAGPDANALTDSGAPETTTHVQRGDLTTTTTPPTTVPTTTTTSTTTAPSTTIAQAPTTTETTTTTTPTTSTTTTPNRSFVHLSYNSGTNVVDGISVAVQGTELRVFVDEVLVDVVPVQPDQQTVPVVLDVTDLRTGTHEVRLDLYRNDTRVSSVTSPFEV